MQIVVHYHEIALKGNNRNVFVKQLCRNLKQTFRDMGAFQVRTLYGRLVCSLDSQDLDTVHQRMRGVFGVANYALVREVPQDFEEICSAALAAAREAYENSGYTTFAVRCRRPDKRFNMRSLDIEREAGGQVLDRANAQGIPLKVDLTNPQITIRIEIVNGVALVSGNRHKGPGGLPVGTGGRLVGMFSSGFDSPVACHHMMKRGAQVILCHFHSYPFTNKASLENCKELARILTRYQLHTVVYMVGFAPVQEELLSLTPADLRMILYRRSMMRIAQLVGRREHCEALVTGESLGQVASQTLTNMAVINQSAYMPVLRPLVGSDKEEIMTEAKAIGTYTISAQPYEDCCSLMLSDHPCTRASLEQVQAIEQAMENLTQLEAQSVEQAEVIFMQMKDGEIQEKVVQQPTYKEYAEGCCLLPS